MSKEKFYSIRDAAKAVNTTSETLRHYDRIGLVKPGWKDEWTNYRYYTRHDIIRLRTIKLLQLMGLSLKEIKDMLECDNLEEIISFLESAEKKADEKIAALQYGKEKIRLAKADYERKLRQKHDNHHNVYVKDIPQRVIMLSDTLFRPTLDNLWNYLEHFYENLPEAVRDQFAFEDLAGIYTDNTTSRLFAVCIRHADIENIKVLPGGKYLCAHCREENREQILKQLTDTARTEYGAQPEFSIQLIVVSGILHWDYEIQIPLCEE